MEDRLSELPDALIHYIMSFFPVAESTRLSTLSKRLSYAWLSFPLLKFDSTVLWKCREDIFLDMVSHSLQRHRTLKTLIRRLTFYSYFYRALSSYDFAADLVADLVNFAISHKIPELKLSIDGYPGLHSPFSEDSTIKTFPNAIFSAQTIEVLNLTGLKLGSLDLILSCPLIEDFSLFSCTGLKSVELGACVQRMKAFGIHNCSGLERIHIPHGHGTPILESFTYGGNFESKSPSGSILEHCDINISGCTHLKNVELLAANLTDTWIRENFPGLRFLQNLIFGDCHFTLNPARFYLENLKSLEPCRCKYLLSCIEMETPNVGSFTYRGDLMPSPPIVLIWSNLKNAKIPLAFNFCSKVEIDQFPLRDFMAFFAYRDTILFSGLYTACTLHLRFYFPRFIEKRVLDVS